MNNYIIKSNDFVGLSNTMVDHHGWSYTDAKEACAIFSEYLRKKEEVPTSFFGRLVKASNAYVAKGFVIR